MQADWFRSAVAAPAAYADADGKRVFNFRASSMKIRTAGTVQFSWDGVNDHGEIVAADGWVDFREISKGQIWVKGGAAVQIIAWSGDSD